MDDNFITAQQAAKAWGISDRRVRVLCGGEKTFEKACLFILMWYNDHASNRGVSRP